MESTSIYWIPIWRVLCSDFDVKLVNPLFYQTTPRAQIDVKDAHCIATVLEKDLIKRSFIPSPIIQELRLQILYLNQIY